MGISLRPNGMTGAAHALRYWERRQEVVANNLANVSTDGFKAERVFAQLVDGALPEIDARTDLRAGSLRPTGGALDFALGGDGFFIVETPEGDRLSRGGAFRLDDDHRLVTSDGHPVLGEGGPIVLDPEDAAAVAEGGASAGITGGQEGAMVQVDREGGVRIGGRTVATLRIERVPPNTHLEHAGNSLFVPPNGRESVPPSERNVRQGVLEESNVSSVGSLVEMITVQRAYAAVQKAMTTLDAARGLLTNEIGKPV